MQMQTSAMICTSTIGIDNNPVGGSSNDPIEAGARGNGNNNTQDKLDLI